LVTQASDQLRSFATPSLFQRQTFFIIFKRVKADATTFSSGRIRANANKKIETTGYDPIYKLGVNYEGERVILGVNISNRSIHSKSNTAITSVLSDKRAQASVFDERNDFDVTSLFCFSVT
jgi:hypothetical protein